MHFKIVGRISNVEVVATGKGIRELSRLRKKYRGGRWRKLKGTANVVLNDGTMHHVELHWYELHGYGKKEFKIKRFLGEA